MVFIFIFIPPAPFAHPRPSKTKSAISLSQKIKSILRLANSYPPIQPSKRQLLKRSIFTGTRYPSCTKQSDHISRQKRIFTQPTLTSNFPLDFFFSFSSNKSCLLPITDETPGMSSLPLPTQSAKRFGKNPPFPPRGKLGRRLTFVM